MNRDLRAAPWPAEHLAELRTYHNPCGWSCAATADYRECEIARWLATLDSALAAPATGDSRPEPTQDQRCGICQFRFRFHASVDHPFTRPGDSRQSEGRDIIAKAIHRVCPSRVKHGFAYHWPEADAALVATPEPTLDAERLALLLREHWLHELSNRCACGVIVPRERHPEHIAAALAARLHERK